MSKPYGKELILDLHGCDARHFNRADLRGFFRMLCERLDMEPEDLHFWDDVDVPPEERQTDPRTKGTSAVQFIITSTIVVHTLDLLGKAFINVFSCKPFLTSEVAEFCADFFAGTIAHMTVVERK